MLDTIMGIAAGGQRLRPARAQPLVSDLLSSPEGTMIVVAILRGGFQCIGGILSEKRPRACCKHGPRWKTRSIWIAILREVRPRSCYLVRQGNLGSLQFARLPGSLVQIHSEIPAMPLWEHELNVGRVVGARLEIARSRTRCIVGIRHLREVKRRLLVGEVIAVHWVARIRGGLLIKDAESGTFEE